LRGPKDKAGVVSIELRKGDYAYEQLSDWRDIATDYVLGTVEGAITSDLDEEHNRVTIGALPGHEESVAAAARRIFEIHGAPAAALRIVTQDRPTSTTRLALPRLLWPSTLGGVDSLAGGMRIYWGPPSGTSLTGGCSIGFTANLGGINRGFITASHCSTTLWNNDSTHYYQLSLSQQVGQEFYDRPSSPCTWPCGVSRYSDATLVKTSGSRAVLVGRILRPEARVYASTTDTVTSTTKPYLFVNIAGSTITNGSTVDFIGATSGWTYGNITQTCTDFYDDYPFPSGNRRQCSYKTDMEARPGDSGGAVFYYDGEDGVTAIGILFAKSGSSDSWFSGWAHTYEDLTSGSLTSFTITSGITMSGTPTVSGSFDGSGAPSISWSAVSVSGTSAPTNYKINRATWDAVSGSYIDNGELTTTTSTSFVDFGTYINVDTYLGESYPGTCDYNWISYWIRAYNSGAQATGQTIWFRGAYNPDGCVGH
jgi:hypothetical protein